MVVGSAWMPWLRPIRGVILCSKARAFSAAQTRSRPTRSRSAARQSCTFRQVSSTSELVIPWWTKRASSWPMISPRWVRKAITSCLVTASISSMRATSKVASLAFHTASAFALGITPSSACASQACASISNQIRKRVSGDQMATISGRE